jgi:hypothetical protein
VKRKGFEDLEGDIDKSIDHKNVVFIYKGK